MAVGVVVWDPSGCAPIGHLIENRLRIQAAEREGVVLLPADPDLIDRGPVGYVQRHWGEGIPFHRMVGTRGAFLALHAIVERPHLHWVVRLQPIAPGIAPQGHLRLITDSALPGTAVASLGASAESVDLGKLGALDERGGWTVIGRYPLLVTRGGYLSLCFYGVAAGVRIMWAALTQSVQDSIG